jgi:hypothetical protein
MDTSAVTGEGTSPHVFKKRPVLRIHHLSGTIQVKAAAPLSRAIDPSSRNPHYILRQMFATEVRVSGFAISLPSLPLSQPFFRAYTASFQCRLADGSEGAFFLAVARPIPCVFPFPQLIRLRLGCCGKRHFPKWLRFAKPLAV